jgi:hypothetical protein
VPVVRIMSICMSMYVKPDVTDSFKCSTYIISRILSREQQHWLCMLVRAVGVLAGF